MAKMVLQLRRGGRLLGSWTLEHEPLEMVLADAETGLPVASFLARGHEHLPTIVPDDVPDVDGVDRDAVTASPDDLTLPLPERVPAGPPVGSETAAVRAPQPAEIWRRLDQSWSSDGVLAPGEKMSAYGGRFRLSRSGVLVVRCGPRLSGSATLPDGRAHALPSGEATHRLPPGTSVTLRVGEEGIYIRTASHQS
ncbi:MAG: hypothetical protein AAFV53_12490 [Myxococcota bacterium]